MKPLVLLAILCLAAAAYGQTTATADSMVTVRVKDGNEITGKIVQQDSTQIVLMTPGGLEVRIPRDRIILIEPFRGVLAQGEISESDPNYTRLLFAPTGRPLRAGGAYFADYYIFFPVLSYGLTDWASVQGGVSIFPVVPLRYQVKYLSAKIGKQFNRNFALSGGVLWGGIDKYYAGMLFAANTFGPPEQSLTVGMGLGYYQDEHKKIRLGKDPVLMVGGTARIARHAALVSENWFVISDQISFDEEPLSLAVRFYGTKLSADVGFFAPLKLLTAGFPVPWLSMMYSFGK
jgi:hypothetical protein